VCPPISPARHKRRIVHQVTETKQQVAGGFIVVAAAEGKVAGCTRRWEIAHANLGFGELLIGCRIIGEPDPSGA